MTEHPSIPIRARRAPVETPEETLVVEDPLAYEPGMLRSPRYWLRPRSQELEAEIEQKTETGLAQVTTDPDRLQGGLIDVRDYLPARPRRASRRVRAPERLVCAFLPFQFSDVELHVLPRRGARRFAECRLHDVNDHGICLAAPLPLATGERVHLCVHHREEPTALAVLEVTVLNQRPAPQPACANTETPDCWLHGIRLPEREARLLLKCTLDSLACDQAEREAPALQAVS